MYIDLYIKDPEINISMSSLGASYAYLQVLQKNQKGKVVEEKSRSRKGELVQEIEKDSNIRKAKEFTQSALCLMSRCSSSEGRRSNLKLF